MKQLPHISLSDKDRKAIEETASLLKDKFGVRKIVLFGSKVRGTDTSESDIDLLALTSMPPDWIEKNRMRDALFHLQLKYNVVFNLMIMASSEWETGLISVMPIHREIEEHGAAA